jgi:SPW repeat
LRRDTLPQARAGTSCADSTFSQRADPFHGERLRLPVVPVDPSCRREIKMQWRNESYLDVLKLILGAFLFATPWIYHFGTTAADSRNAWLLGAAIVVLSIAALAAFAAWEEWATLILGLWVLISPWVLGFSAAVTAMRVHVTVGAIVAALAAFELWLMHQSPPRVTA